eukprot:gene18539-biopygen11565
MENMGGAGGATALSRASRAEPDGYTILANSNAHTVNPQLYRSLPYDSATDFVGIATLGSLPNILVVSPQSPFNSVQELVAAARSQPGKLNYASAGVGSGTHMNAEKFRIASGLSAEHIAYKGTPEAVTEVMAGRVDWFFAPGVSVMGAVKERKLKALAVGSKERSSQLPDSPTTEEAGAPNSAYTLWIGLFAPARTPPAIVARLNQEVQAALASLVGQPVALLLLLDGALPSHDAPEAATRLGETGSDGWAGLWLSLRHGQARKDMAARAAGHDQSSFGTQVHAHVDEGLKAHPDAYALRHQTGKHTVHGDGLAANVHEAARQPEEQADHADHANQAKLFANHGQ